jgi:hypothetical protein
MLPSGGMTMPGRSFSGGGQERSVGLDRIGALALALVLVLALAGGLGGNPFERIGMSVSSCGRMILVMLAALVTKGQPW